MDWVVQADCPEDVPCYIHRVGRTARYTAEGRGLLLLTPSEATFAKELAAAKVGEKKKPCICVHPPCQLSHRTLSRFRQLRFSL